ncbi:MULTISPECIES: HeH/LEM domain-containing protein [Lacticaseibacillus]|nr:hypothetical protein [Lacticaseibacillus casei]MCT3344734.1 hypothetical protein [Lacticaseibacillus paracasei]MBO1482532.1 hypothetical protein [Lacticaseibacillus casei]MBO2417815.1 hypothetical protein [Lacticaseibacillus casei]MCK2082196.1 hypothetical protein [Lacticaseibacillus casei]
MVSPVEAGADSNSTVAQLKSYLDSKRISYPSNALKADLQKLAGVTPDE